MAYCQFKDEYLGMFDDKDIWTTSWLEDLIDWIPFFRWQINNNNNGNILFSINKYNIIQ